MEIYHMENERFARLDEKLDLIKSKMERINYLLDEANGSAQKSIENMNFTSDKLSTSHRRDASSMQKTMNKVESEINNRSLEQAKKVSLISTMLLKQESMLTDLKEDEGTYSQAEIDFYIKEVNQDLKNNEVWNKPEYSFKKVDFTNHGGLRGMIFTPIADFNKKSDELAKAIYEVEVLMYEINEERLNIELDRLESMKKPAVLDIQPDFEPSFEPQVLDILIESQSGFEFTYEDYLTIDSPIDFVEVPSFACDCGGLGRTAFCM
jgi:hypothetical protein